MPQTFVEKVLARKAGVSEVEPGDIVNIEPDLCMSHDNAGLVIKQFRQIGVGRVWDPSRIVIPLDHRAPAESEKTATAHKSIREFVQEQGIEAFYDIREGICHQVVVEKTHILPGQVGVGTDSHTTSYGAVAAFSTGIGATEMACLWATGKVWLRVPETIAIAVEGELPFRVYAKDIILHIIGELGAEGASYRAVEFYGETVEGMSVSERFTLANLSMEMGAKSAVIPFDEVTRDYLAQRGAFERGTGSHPDAARGSGEVAAEYVVIVPDRGARHEAEYEFRVDGLEPQVACPHAVDNVRPVAELLDLAIDQAVLGSCTNGRIDDLEIAAAILDGKRLHPRVRMLVIPASRETYRTAMERGYLDIFVDTGCVILNPGCGPCLGAHQGILAPGERCIATTNRNFRGRMGSRDAEVYLASPATVAASAIAGHVADPRR
jgi:3-isopropylmalate/(R)-2-methylmalate dehydratase large subunit